MEQKLRHAIREGQKIEWPGVIYKGLDLFESYIETNEFTDAFGEMDGDIDSQECYLGYIPSHDMFISGYDVWFDETKECDVCDGTGEDIDGEDAEDCGWCDNGEVESDTSTNFEGNAFLFTIDEGGNMKIFDTVACLGRMFYSDGMYKHIKTIYPDLVDIRLD